MVILYCKLPKNPIPNILTEGIISLVKLGLKTNLWCNIKHIKLLISLNY